MGLKKVRLNGQAQRIVVNELYTNLESDNKQGTAGLYPGTCIVQYLKQQCGSGNAVHSHQVCRDTKLMETQG